MTEPLTGWKHRLDEWRKIASGITSLGAFFALVWFMLGPPREWIADYLAASSAESALLKSTAEAVIRLETGQERMREDIRSIKGENRVIREKKGMAFVQEPVHVGEQIKLVQFIGRTDVGAACRAGDYTPIFVDSQGVQRPGASFPAPNQLGLEMVRREIVIDLPANIAPGRTVLQLQIEYQCGVSPVFETTDPVAFEILEAKR